MRTISEAFDFVENEIWKDVPNYEGFYKASNYGRIISLGRVIKYSTGKSIPIKEKMLSFKSKSSIYYSLVFTKSNQKKQYKLHQVIAMTFLGHKPNKFGVTVNHINGNKKDNRLCNLELLSNRENTADGFSRLPKSSKYAGVYWNNRDLIFKTNLTINNRTVYLGSYKNEDLAGLVYVNAVKNLDKYILRENYLESDKEFRDYIRNLSLNEINK